MKSPEQEAIEDKANRLIQYAESLGMVVTIKLEPLKPFAMGHHKMVAEVTPKKAY